MHIVILIGSLI